MIDTHCDKCGRACYEWWEVTVSPSFVNAPGASRYRFCGKCYKEIKTHFKAETAAMPQKAPLCLSCKHGEIGAVDDFATCYCPHHGYVGQKTECGEYEAKAGACGKCRQFDKGDNSTFGYCFRNDEIVDETSVKGCFEPRDKAEERPEPLGTVTTH